MGQGKYDLRASDNSDAKVPGSIPASVRQVPVDDSRRFPTRTLSLRLPNAKPSLPRARPMRNMDKRQHRHCFLSAHFAELSWSESDSDSRAESESGPPPSRIFTRRDAAQAPRAGLRARLGLVAPRPRLCQAVPPASESAHAAMPGPRAGPPLTRAASFASTVTRVNPYPGRALPAPTRAPP